MKTQIIFVAFAAVLLFTPSWANSKWIDSEQLANAFVSYWYLSDTRGLPTTEETNGLKRFLSDDVLKALMMANEKRAEAIRQMRMDQPMPYSDGDILGGEYEAPSYFYFTKIDKNAEYKVEVNLVYSEKREEFKKSILLLITESTEGLKIKEMIINPSKTEKVEFTKFLHSLSY